MNAIKLLLDASSVGFSLNVLKMTADFDWRKGSWTLCSLITSLHYSTSPDTRFVNVVGPVLDISS